MWDVWFDGQIVCSNIEHPSIINKIQCTYSSVPNRSVALYKILPEVFFPPTLRFGIVKNNCIQCTTASHQCTMKKHLECDPIKGIWILFKKLFLRIMSLKFSLKACFHGHKKKNFQFKEIWLNSMWLSFIQETILVKRKFCH